MEREELMRHLPHRGQMLLLDRAYVTEDVAHGERRIRGDEFFLDGHFPGDPIVPGVILCEILAQSACVLLPDGHGDVQTLFTGLDHVKFRRPVRPGETFCTECRITRQSGIFYRAEGRGFVGAELCVSAQFSFALPPKSTETKEVL